METETARNGHVSSGRELPDREVANPMSVSSGSLSVPARPFRRKPAMCQKANLLEVTCAIAAARKVRLRYPCCLNEG